MLKTGPNNIPISIRKIDSGILVLLKKKLPINPTSITIPKIKMPLLIVIYYQLIDLTLFFLIKNKAMPTTSNKIPINIDRKAI